MQISPKLVVLTYDQYNKPLLKTKPAIYYDLGQLILSKSQNVSPKCNKSTSYELVDWIKQGIHKRFHQ